MHYVFSVSVYNVFSYRTENAKEDKFVLTVQSHQIVLELSLIHFWIWPETFEFILVRPMWVLSLSRQFQNCFRARQHCRLIYLQILRQQCFLLSAYIFYAPKLFRRHAEELSGIWGLCILPLDIFRNNSNMQNIYSKINCMTANGQEAWSIYFLVYFQIIDMFRKIPTKMFR